MFHSLRDFIKHLESKGQLVRVKKTVSRYLEVNQVAKASIDKNGPALYFEDVEGYDIPIVAAVYGNRDRIFEALGTGAESFSQVYTQKLELINNFSPKIVTQGACKENIITDNPDLNMLPLTWHADLDGGWYISSGVCISKDPNSQIRNASFHRLKIHSAQKFGLWMSPFDLKRIVDNYWQQGKPCPIAVAIGVDPYTAMAASTSIPYEQDEFSLAGALRGEPMDLISCETIPLEVPTNAEIILEGWAHPDDQQEEGPFGETSGHYSIPKMAPVVTITAITHRNKPIYQDMVAGIPPDENQALLITHQARAYQAVTEIFPESVLDVYLTPGGCTSFNAVIKIKKKYPGEAKQIGANALTLLPRLKSVWVVDEDIDHLNPIQVEWAYATRCRGERDILILKMVKSVPLDPCAVNGMVDKIVYDCTKPFPEEMLVGEKENIPCISKFKVKLDDYF